MKQGYFPRGPRVQDRLRLTSEGALARGEFRAQALWMPAPARAPGGADRGTAGPSDIGDDPELALILAAIPDDVQRKAGANHPKGRVRVERWTFYTLPKVQSLRQMYS
jgi:hypothetical protein